ncbi:MAG: 4'-phosphopantetheinyl transferase superfamily protein [Oscillospiraceae bacterium]|jgi:holo-[acyl-carrier protein] synthase|nr:4'-phosphopantetheinyl transferase superfamily protein [Oscillospiraceae bacterium]
MRIGLDLLETERMERLLENAAFMRRAFSASEREYIQSRGGSAAQTAAGIFCAKEALAKAAGVGLIAVLRAHEIRHEDSGTPYFDIPGVSVSITHTARTAAACVLFDPGKAKF